MFQEDNTLLWPVRLEDILKIRPDSTVKVNWDDKGVQEVRLATTEFFMPILVGMELPDFASYVRFCLFENSHDLATSIWTRDDRKLQLARRTIGGVPVSCHPG